MTLESVFVRQQWAVAVLTRAPRVLVRGARSNERHVIARIYTRSYTGVAVFFCTFLFFLNTTHRLDVNNNYDNNR